MKKCLVNKNSLAEPTKKRTDTLFYFSKSADKKPGKGVHEHVNNIFNSGHCLHYFIHLSILQFSIYNLLQAQEHKNDFRIISLYEYIASL